MSGTARRQPPGGRPRSSGVDEAVLKATVHRLIQDGCAGTSVATVAADAGTARPTTYLRRPTKQSLVVAAVRAVLPEPVHVLSDEWFRRFSAAIGELPERRRQQSVLPLRHSIRRPEPPVDGSPIPADRFGAAVREAKIGVAQDIAHLSADLIRTYAADPERLACCGSGAPVDHPALSAG